MGVNGIKKKMSRRLLFSILAALAALVGAFSAVTTARAQSGETGNVCVQDYQPGANCTANDVRVEELRVYNLIEGCGEGTIGEMEVEFEALVSAEGSPDRYDIGLFLALDGGLDTALTGDNCFHDYLAPPLTTSPTYSDYNTDGINDVWGGPWWNGEISDPSDTCGDMETNTQVFKVLESLRVPCVDNDGDPAGAADIHVCASWDMNVQTTCSGVTTAYPGNNSKCGCATVNLPFTTNAVSVTKASSRTHNTSVLFATVITGLTLGLGVPLAMRLRARQALHKQTTRNDQVQAGSPVGVSIWDEGNPAER